MIEEPFENGSIVLAHSGATELQALWRNGTVVHRVDLTEGEGGWKPIWYRERSQVINVSEPGGTLALGNGFFAPLPARASSRTDATVYGRARVKPQGLGLDATLWALIDQKIIDCPPDLFHESDVERILTWPQSQRKLIAI